MRGLARRFRNRASIPFVCQDWANTKAAYRFLANHRVNKATLSGHFQSTRERVWQQQVIILVLHDTTEFTYQRDRPELIGITKCGHQQQTRSGWQSPFFARLWGMEKFHSSLAITTAGLPLGILRR